MNQFTDQTLYEILEVDENATQEEILKAFQRAKSTYSVSSPALYSVFSRDEAEELLRVINEAYTILSNQATRRNYDQSVIDKIMARKNSTQGGNGGATAVGSTKSDANVRATPQSEAAQSDYAIPQSTSTDWDPNKKEKSIQVDPEFDEAAASQAHVRSKESLKIGSQVQGAGRTRFSTYEIDPLIEQEIANQDTFDGAFLQKIRSYKRLSLDQISEFSRIGRHYLIAVENNDFLSLPAPVFVRGFLVQIAKILGLDERRAVESYMRLYKQSREKR